MASNDFSHGQGSVGSAITSKRAVMSSTDPTLPRFGTDLMTLQLHFLLVARMVSTLGVTVEL
jgi:hypothetical protein